MNLARWKPATRLSAGFALGVAVAAGSWFAYGSGSLERTELQLYDLRFRLRGARESANKDRIVLVALDNRTIEEAGKKGLRTSPLDRRVYAQAIVNMGKAGAKLVLMDVLFRLRRSQGEDEALVAALDEAYNVECGVILAADVKGGKLRLPYAGLQEVWQDVAHVYIDADEDDVLRRVAAPSMLHDQFDPPYVGALPVQGAIYTLAEDLPDDEFAQIRDRLLHWPPFYINYVAPTHRTDVGRDAGFKVVSLWDVYDGDAKELAKVLKGKTILVGSTQFAEDDVSTPFTRTIEKEIRLPNDVTVYEKQRPLMPGVEYHANALATILDERPIRRMNVQFGIAGMLALMAGVAAVAIVAFFPMRWGLTIKVPALLVGLAGLGLYAYFAFKWGDYMVEVVPLAALWGSEFVVGVMYQVLFLRQRNRQIRGVFGRYVSPAVLKKIMVDPEAAYVVEEKDVSVLFSDIRSFTSMSERMQPADVIALLNEYFDSMVEAIFAANGSVDKFVGDEIMAVFGAPFALPDHPKWAVRTGMAMQECVRLFNTRRRERNLQEIQMGVGIHSGPVVAGTVGARQRVEYSVIGDTVNTAARIEGQTSGFQVLVSRSTYEAVRDIVEVEELPAVQVKGKAEPLQIYEVTRVTDGSVEPIVEHVRQQLAREH